MRENTSILHCLQAGRPKECIFKSSRNYSCHAVGWTPNCGTSRSKGTTVKGDAKND